MTSFDSRDRVPRHWLLRLVKSKGLSAQVTKNGYKLSALSIHPRPFSLNSNSNFSLELNRGPLPNYVSAVAYVDR